MNSTSRAIIQTVITTDASLSVEERGAIQRVLDGIFTTTGSAEPRNADRLLVTQKAAAKLLSVSRVTVWRMTKDCMLHPVEVLPGTWRYPYHEIAAISRGKAMVDPAEAVTSRQQMTAG